MLILTIVKEKKPWFDRPAYHFRVGDAAQTGGDVEVIEVLNQKEGESRAALEKRADDFLRDYAVMYG